MQVRAFMCVQVPQVSRSPGGEAAWTSPSQVCCLVLGGGHRSGCCCATPTCKQRLKNSSGCLKHRVGVRPVSPTSPRLGKQS